MYIPKGGPPKGVHYIVNILAVFNTHDNLQTTMFCFSHLRVHMCIILIQVCTIVYAVDHNYSGNYDNITCMNCIYVSIVISVSRA